MTKPEICLIVAVGPDNVIGKDKTLVWHSKLDFHHFKTVTRGYACLFGDNTFYNLPKYPLKDRLNIVASFNCKNSHLCTSNDDFEGCYIRVPTVEEGIRVASNYSKIFICGGMSIYKYCLDNNLIDKIYYTHITSSSLENEIKKCPEQYIRFPVDIEKYLENWVCEGPLKYNDLENDTELNVLIQVWRKEK